MRSVFRPSEWPEVELLGVRGREAAGTRCLLETPWCRDLALRVRQHAALAALIPATHVAVQCTYFEKSSTTNWLVSPHQDLNLPVAERVHAQGLRGWSIKEGAHFVLGPPEVMGQMVAVRLHVDRCHAADGALRVWPGTHLGGVLDADAMAPDRAEVPEVLVEADEGDALLMSPLLLHASSKSTSDGRRRVLHFLFGPPALPQGLRWARAV
ncbi:phytanoyl-CoA dioxygenase family protein [Inhella sp. 4Y17]|uniref:Phytanoyl-CoA dioxygenase family protein n=1 Tax=Inhella gelatinilytica TaxID=2795030 RepID=A0A931IT98_9BURK|nr:phytanoyl-CoA dioxygenase family protein [Inhella gelatinilytica]